MTYTSLLRLALFVFAMYANVVYARFLFNPLHAQNIFLYVLALIADTLTLLILSYTWISCLYFEIFKAKYYSEITYLQDKGQFLLKKKTAVLIPVVNESLTLIRKTLNAALKMEGVKNVYLLDDGRRKELELLAYDLGINYLRRNDRSYNKAGNINHALTVVDEDFVAVFDADFIPNVNFLKETLPLFSDMTIGIVQTPQIYYNENNFFSKGFKNFQSIFYNYIMPSKSLQNSAICVGTNVVYRKSSLDLIGGVPRLQHSEDINTSLKMYEKGIRTFYLNKNLAEGLSPDNVISFFNQQFRWSKGGFTMLFRNNTLFNRKLTWDQRLQFFFSNLFYLTGITIFIYLITPLLAIIFNSSAINPDFFFEWVSSYALFFTANFIFYSLLVRKNILQTIALGIFCYIPYTKAINGALFNRGFNWKTTNANSSDIVTKLIAPFFPYIITSIAVLYLFVIGFLAFEATLILYAFWIAVNTLIILYLIINCYLSVLIKHKVKSSEEVKSFTIPSMMIQTT